MAKGGKKGRKGKKGKKGDEDGENEGQKDKLLEVDKEMFKVQIQTLEDKLDRRNDRAKTLEVSNKDFQNK